MKITVIGRGNVGGGLADRWERAGHTVTRLGHDGGDAADADAVVIAVPGAAVADALRKVTGAEGKVAIDATNAVNVDRGEFESLAEQVKSLTRGPVAKAFSANFANQYDRIDEQRVRPSNIYAADEGAREVTEQLIRDAGYEPVNVGGLEQARKIEDHLGLLFAVSQAGLGPFFYRYSRAGEL
jgi:predicted dinucleotide-binding enzyme